jgi:hypothetical protein
MDQAVNRETRIRNRIRAFWRRKLRPAWQDYQWAVIGGLIICTIIIGGTYLWLQLFNRESGSVRWSLSPWLVAFKLLATISFIFAFIKALAVIFSQQIELIRLKITNNHVIICGIGQIGSSFIEAFYKDGFKVIAITNNDDNHRLDKFRDLKIITLIGNAADREILHKARVHTARYLIAVWGKDEDNIEIAVNARAMVPDSKNRVLTSLVHITNPYLCSLLKEREIMGQKVTSFRIEFFNVYESGARQLLKEFPPFDENVGTFQPHLLIVGLGEMGKSLTVHAAMLWRMARGKSIKKLPITIVDKNADQKKEYLEWQYRQLNDSWEISPVTINIESQHFYQAKFLRNEYNHCIATMVYVCLNKDSRSLSAALSLFKHLRYDNVDIVVQMNHDAGMSTLLQNDDRMEGSFANIHFFWLFGGKCKADLLLYSIHEVLARAIHQDYLSIQTKMGITLKDNPCLVTWNELPEDIKESNRRQADDIGKKLKAVHCDLEPLTDWDAELFEFTPEEIEILARMEHQRWLNEHMNEGWKYNPGAKDLNRKTSPYLLDWDELPEDFKKYNRDAMQSLPIFLARADFQILRNRQKY